jgi:hypothetical protein
VVVRTFIHHDRAGTNKLRLGVYVPVSELIPGEYRLRSIMLDAAGVKHTSYSLLRIVAAPSRHPSKRAATIGPALADVLRRLAALL